MSNDRARAFFKQADSVRRALTTVSRSLDLGYPNVAARLMDEVRKPYDVLWRLASFSPYLVDSARAWGVAIEQMEIRVRAALAGPIVQEATRDAQP